MERVIAALRAAPGSTWVSGAVIVALIVALESAALLAVRPAGWDPLALLPSSVQEVVAEIDQAGELELAARQLVVSTLGSVLGLVGFAVVAGIATIALAELDTHGRAPVRVVLRRFGGRLGAVVGLALLWVATIALLTALPPLTLLVLGPRTSWPAVLWLAVLAGAVSLAAAFWLLPGIALAVPCAATPSPAPPASPSLVARSFVRPRERFREASREGSRGHPISSLRAGFDLACGHRWGVVGVWLLTTIVVSLASHAVAVPFSWLTSVLDAGAAPGTLDLVASSATAELVALAGAVVSAAVTVPLGSLVLAALASDLRQQPS